MLPGPIFDRETVITFRRKRTYVIQGLFMVAMFGLLVMLWPKEYGDLSSLPIASRTLFQGLVFMEFFALALLVPAFAGPALSEEKETNTLGVLLLSDTGPLEIVVGKGLFKFCYVLILMVLALPMFLSLLTIGGITYEELYRVSIVLAGFAFLTTTLCVFLSVISRKNYGAITKGYLCIFAYAFLLPQALKLKLLSWLGTFARPQYLSPFHDILFIFEPGQAEFGYPSDHYTADWWWLNPLLSVGIGVGFLFLAAARVPSVALSKGGGERGALLEKIIPKWLYPRGEVAGNPVYWKEVTSGLFGRSLPEGVVLPLLFIGMAVVYFFLWDKFAPGWSGFMASWESGTPMSGATSAAKDAAIVLHALIVSGMMGVVVLACTVVSATAITREHEERTWEVLASTPVDVDTYLRGKVTGLSRNLLPFIFLPIAHLALFTLVGVLPWYVLPFHLLVIPISVATYSMQGLYLSFRAGTSVRAVILAVLVTFVEMAALWCVCCAPLSPVVASYVSIDPQGFLGWTTQELLTWLGFGCVVSLISIAYPWLIYKHLRVRFDRLLGRTA